MVSEQYSGVDVEFNDKTNKLLVLSNCQKYPFSIMELDLFGNVTQQPVLYEFTMNEIGNARAHIMHYLGDRLLVTGNFFVKDPTQIDVLRQHLFDYQINDPNDLNNGNSTFNSYSQQVVPVGKQKEVTGYWAPENSYYKDGLSIVGIYNGNPYYGYTLVHTSGYVNEPGCLEIGSVAINHISTVSYTRDINLAYCEKFPMLFTISNPPTPRIKSCPSGEKNSLIEDTESNWRYLGIDETGIHAYLNSEVDSQYEISVYDLTGRKVCSENYSVKGQKYINLKFNVGNQIYLIKVSNGTQTETLKVCGVK